MSLLNGTGGGSNVSTLLDQNGNPVPYWNYAQATTPEGKARDDFRQKIRGTFVDVAEVQATKFGSNELDWWDDAKTQPKMDLELVIQSKSGNNLNWHIKPGSTSNYAKFSVARKALVDAARKITGDPNTNDITTLLGFDLTIETKDQYTTDGKVVPYGSGMPRPWTVTVNGVGDQNAVRFGKQPTTSEPTDEGQNPAPEVADEDIDF